MTDEQKRIVTELRKHGLGNGSMGYHSGWMDEAAEIVEQLIAETERLSEEKDTLMKRRKEQIEVIRMRVDKDGLCDVEKRMLNDLKLPSNYDRRLTDTRRERGDLND